MSQAHETLGGVGKINRQEGEEWKSSHSAGGSDCLLVSVKGDLVGIRDSKDSGETTIAVKKHRFASFIGGVKTGEFDRPS